MEILIEFKFSRWIVRKDYSTMSSFSSTDYEESLKKAKIIADVLKVPIRKVNGGDNKIVYPEAQ